MELKALHNAPSVRLAKRLAAAVYDWLLVLGIVMVISVPLVAMLGDAIEPGNLLYQAALICIAGAFFSWFWSHGGQTLGMRAWRLSVVSADGGEVSLRQALLRYCCAWISLLPAGLGFWWALLDRQNRCWHDLWTGTRLVQLPKKQSMTAG